MSGSPVLAIYLAAMRLAGPLAPVLLRRRAARGREDTARIGERIGRAGVPRPEGRLIWLHGASIGEAMSLLPLIAELRSQAPRATCLVTTGTVTSARRMAEMLPGGCIHQYCPVDTGGAVRKFLDHWRPDLAIWTESEFWPGLMTATARRGTPMMLINARISARSARRWAWAPGMAAEMVRVFRHIVAQDPETVARLLAMGADPGQVREGGNLKTLIPPPGCDAGELAALRGVLVGRSVWLAASTHATEEDAVARAHRVAAMKLNGLLTILAPRHPERGDEIATLLTGKGLTVARRSRGERPGPETDVWLADTLGEMGLWLRLAWVAFIGGSIAPSGGHNPFEAAALGVAILHGPETASFAPAYAALARAGAARLVADGAQMGTAVVELMETEATRVAMANAAASVRQSLEPDIGAMAGEALALMEAGP